MLDWFATQRFAPSDSPLRERRLCQFARVRTGGTGGNTPDPAGATPDPQHAAPNTPTNPNTPGQPTATVEGQQHQTQSSVDNLLQSEGQLLKEVRDGVKSVSGKLTETSEQLNKTEELIKTSQIGQKEKHLEMFKANRQSISDTHETMASWNRLLDVVDDWGGGKVHPENFCNALSKDLFGRNKQGENVNMRSEYARDMAEKLYEASPELRNWDMLDHSTRIELARESKNFVLNYMKEYIKKINDELQKQQDYGKILAQYKKDLEEQESRTGGGFGIEWYSINHIIASVNNVYEAFKKAGEEWSQLKIASLSHKLGKMVKFVPVIGDSALQTLEATLNHKDDDVAKHYQEHLESDLAPFNHMIDGHGPGSGMLSRNKNDGNRFRGSLQYMAKHAWLYDLDFENNAVMGFKLIPGQTVPATWGKDQIREYMRELERQNQAGQEAETKRGYARVDFAGVIDAGIKILEEEIDDGNYWAVRGISQRLLAKAKDGYTATWIAATIMRKLRTNSQARRYFPFELLDRLGNEGLTHLAMTNICWVINRREIRDWQKATWQDDKAAEERVAETGIMGRITSEIEAKIRAVEKANHVEKDKQLKSPELDKLIAKILASRVLNTEEDPEPRYEMFKGISIFHKDFKWYRDGFKKTEGNTIDPSKTDDDFTKEDSEIVMHGPAVASAIVAIRSPADLTHRAKALAYMGMLLRRDRQLKSANLTDEQRNFRKETQETFRVIFENEWNKDAVFIFTQLEHNESLKEGKKLLQAMVDHELISKDHIRNHDSKLCIALCEQIGIKHNAVKKREAEGSDKKTQDYASGTKSSVTATERAEKDSKDSLASMEESVNDIEAKLPPDTHPDYAAANDALEKAKEAVEMAKTNVQAVVDGAKVVKDTSVAIRQHAEDSKKAVTELDEVKAKELEGKAKKASEDIAAAVEKVENAAAVVAKQKAIVDKIAKTAYDEDRDRRKANP